MTAGTEHTGEPEVTEVEPAARIEALAAEVDDSDARLALIRSSRERQARNAALAAAALRQRNETTPG